MLKSGAVIGPYTLVKRLGQGSFGTVWLAERRGRLATTQVALKMPIVAPDDLDEFAEEAKVWSRAGSHTNVHPMIEADVYDDVPVMVSEYAADGSLENWLERNGDRAPDERRAVEMVIGILRGLQHLHDRQIIHRDLKPANVLLHGETPRITDFGLARTLLRSRHQSGMGHGSPAYMAPELRMVKAAMRVASYTVASDIYAVGVILFELLCGDIPYPDPPSAMLGMLPERFRPIVAAATAADPAARYASASAMQAPLAPMIAPPVISPPRLEFEVPPPPKPVAVVTDPRRPTPDPRTNPVDGAEMVWIPGGKWQLGDSDQSSNPVHTVTLSGCWMYRYPVTVAQFRRFTKDRVRNGGFTYDWNGSKPSWGWIDDHPMVCVSWEVASAYCQWAGVSLPSESQWEHAARGPEGWKYPWGNEFDVSKLHCSKKEWGDAKRTAKVGSYPANAYGLYDMAGNVWEWCADWYDAAFWKNSANFSNIDPVNRNSNDSRVLRGGSWYYYFPESFRASCRVSIVPAFRDNIFGFRGCSQD